MFDLTGRVALVTGAGQGVGAGIARALAAQGAAVAVNDFHLDRAEATAGVIAAAGGRALALAFDVTDYAAVDAGVQQAVGALGPIDILVNNAGNGGVDGMRLEQFRNSDPANWRAPVDVNLYGVLNCARVVINPMVERRWGRIITIASGAGMTGLRLGVAPYGAGKGGAIGFMRHLAIENARDGVTANTLALGLMDASGRGQGEATRSLQRQIPVGRLGTPDDVGAFCVFLASYEAEWITGQTIHVNGGAVTS